MDCVKCSEVGISAVNTTYTGYLSVCSGNAAHIDISFVDAKEICHFAMPDYLHFPLLRGIRENPRDGGAWWAAISGVTQSWTRLK